MGMQLENALYLRDGLRVSVRAVAGRDDEFAFRRVHVAAPIRDDSIGHGGSRFVLVAAFAAVAADDVMRDAGRHRDGLNARARNDCSA